MGCALLSQGRLQDAAAAFERGIAQHSGVAELHLNAAVTYTKLQRYDDARTHYRRALSLRDEPSAHFALYELEQIAGRRNEAVAHLRAALARQHVFSSYAPNERRRLLAAMAPGDWQANVPVDFLIDFHTTTVHKVYLCGDDVPNDPLAAADVFFTAIAHSRENAGALDAAQRLVERLAIPVINRPRHVGALDRVSVYEQLRNIPHVRVPHTVELDAAEVGDVKNFPLVVRPVDSQAGRDLAKIDDAQALSAYLRETAAPRYHVMPFEPYASADGYFRKYRIFVVDDEPLPCHLAISRNWMVHYYNAPMREHAWMRDEERNVLERFEVAFPAELREALVACAKRLDLEYVGFDCSVAPDGHLLIFEADPAMIVHAADDEQLFAYKHEAARRIFDAFTRLMDRARSG